MDRPLCPRAQGLKWQGVVVVYVDDFAVVSSDPVSELVKQAVEAKWKISDKPLAPFGSGLMAEYLSVEITAAADGWQLSQKTYC